MTAKQSLKVMSCVPQQRYHFKDKLAWADQQLKKHKPDVLVLPQEYHGGIQTEFFQKMGTTEKVAYHPDEITGPYERLAKARGAGIAVGAVVDDPKLGERRERIFIIDPTLGTTGYVDKMMLPGYDHVDAKGRIQITPESNFANRAQAFDLCGARVGVLFCWEVYSSFLWHAIAEAQPDFVVSMVKFGVNGWPAKGKGGTKVISQITGEETEVGEKGSTFDGFGFGDDGGWIERLRMASKWDLAAPIICSTNSWNLPKKCGAIYGQVLPFAEKAVSGEKSKWPREARVDTLRITEGKGDLLEDLVQIDQVDFLYWRYIRDHKTLLFGATNEWPSSEARAFTMAWKIRRMERKFAGLPKLAAGNPPKAIVAVNAVKAGQGLLSGMDP